MAYIYRRRYVPPSRRFLTLGALLLAASAAACEAEDPWVPSR